MPLSLCRTHLAFLHATTLKAPVVRFDSPGLARQAFPLLLRHFQQVAQCSTIFGDRPKHPDKPIASQAPAGPPGVSPLAKGKFPALGVHPPVGPQWLSQNHPLSLMAFKFSRLVYQLSNSTQRG